MKSICLIFQIHQPFRYRKYRFFDIGKDDYYYDDYANETIMRKIADKCYLPANKIILDQIRKHQGKFKVAFSLSGVVIDQFKLYCPEVITSFAELAKTGCVEFLSETYANSLVSLLCVYLRNK
jgi:alpha-amylase